MKKFGFATIIASGLTAAVLGLAGPAQADIGHHDWVDNIRPAGDRPAGGHQRAPEPLTQGIRRGAPTAGAPLFVAHSPLVLRPATSKEQGESDGAEAQYHGHPCRDVQEDVTSGQAGR